MPLLKSDKQDVKLSLQVIRQGYLTA